MYDKSKSLIIALILCIWSSSGIYTFAQDGNYCSSHKINDISWSPDGNQLAVMTSHGVLFYDKDLELIKSVQAPFGGETLITSVGPVWSPDGEWIILPRHTPAEFVNVAGALNTWSRIHVETGENRPFSPAPFGMKELVWSPDNSTIITLSTYDPPGLDLPYLILESRPGVTKKHFDLELKNLQWVDNQTFTARQDGIIITFDAATLEPIHVALYPSWWVTSPDARWEAAWTNDLNLKVREVGGQEVNVHNSMALYSDDEYLGFGGISDIIWLSDSERFVGVYWRFLSTVEENPNVYKILQGTIVDATSATELNHWYIEADDDIQKYAVSTLDGRITITHNDTIVEVWSALTGELINRVDVPLFPLESICEN